MVDKRVFVAYFLRHRGLSNCIDWGDFMSRWNLAGHLRGFIPHSTLIGSRSGHVTEAWPIRASYHPRVAQRRAGDWIRANDRELFLELALKLRSLSENCELPCCQQEKKAKPAWRSYKEVETSQTLGTRFESLDSTVSDTCFSLPFQLWEPVPRLALKHFALYFLSQQKSPSW